MLPKKITSFLGHLVFLFFLPHRVITHRFCSLTYIRGVYTANCAYRGRVIIPQDLDPAIEVLILSHNNLARIDEDSFSNHENLVELYLNDNHLLNNSFHRNALLPLNNLKILDISYLRHNAPLNINWPSSIEKLTINKNRKQVKLDLSKISKLEVLNAIDCSLSFFPSFNKSAKIEVIDLSKNPLNNFIVKDLSSLCQLQNLYVRWTGESTLNGSEKWCDCLKIETWLHQKSIKATELNCTIPDNAKNSSCDFSFKEETEIYEGCLKNTIKAGRILEFVFFGIISICIVFYIWYSRRHR